MTQRLWLIPVVGAVIAPLITWMPRLAAEAPRLGLPPYPNWAQGIDIWHLQTMWFVFFSIVALLIAQQDRWLGLAVFVLGVGVFFWGGTMDITHRIVFMLGALGLWAMRQVPTGARALVIRTVVALGIFQAAYVFLQVLGADPFFCRGIVGCGAPLPTGGFTKMPLLTGTIGTVDAATAYIAITAPLMPIWALTFAVPAVLAGHSFGAITALGVGLLIRYHRRWEFTAAAGVAMLAIAVWAFATIQNWHIPSTVTGRLAVWRLAFWDWWATDPLMAYQIANPITGNGEWMPRIPMLQQKYKIMPTNEAFAQAHNEYLQWGYTHGALGVSLLGLWLWEHRRMFRDATLGASLVALAIVTGTFFTFQVVSVALLSITIIGLATAADHQEVA